MTRKIAIPLAVSFALWIGFVFWTRSPDGIAAWVSCPTHISNDYDAILYFSADDGYDSSLNRVSKQRLDVVAKNYKPGVWVFLNGYGGADIQTVPMAMDYLEKKGVDRNFMAFEVKSTNTWENLQEALPKIRNMNLTSVLFVSSPYHMDRILRYYQKQNKLRHYDFKISWDSYDHLLDNDYLLAKVFQIQHEILASPRDAIYFGNTMRSGLCN